MLTLLLALFLTQAPDIDPLPSEVMPAGITPIVTAPGPEDATPKVIARPPGNPPWASEDEVGSQSVGPWATNTYGWNIPAEVPRLYKDAAHGASNNAVINTHYSGPGGPVDWTDVLVYGTPASMGQQPTTRWGYILFDLWDATWRNSTVHTIPGEHGYYVTGWAPMRWDRCEFYNIGGQAIQHVYSYPGTKREPQTGLPKHTWLRLNQALLDEWLEVYRCRIMQVGDPTTSERASFALSFFEPTWEGGVLGNPVRVTETFIRTDIPWIDNNGQQRTCTGSFMAHNRQEVVFTRNGVVYRLGDRDVIQVWGCPKVTIAENYILAKQAIDIRVSPGQEYDIELRRNYGDAHVVVSTNPWYAWTNTGWDESKVIYRGHITEPVTLKGYVAKE